MTEYILTKDIVRDAIEELISLPVHRHFPGYLCLVQEANRLSQLSGLEFDYFEFFNTYHKISESNPPYFVPFNKAENPDWSALRFNENVSGTYAPSSLRETSPLRQVATIEGSGYGTNWTLVEQHWEHACESFCGGQKIPLEPLAVFLFRDYSFSAETPNGETLVDAFCEEFYYGRASDAFKHLYEVGSYELTPDDFTKYTGEGAINQATLGSPSQIRSAQKVRQVSLHDLGIPRMKQERDVIEQLLEKAEGAARHTRSDGPDRGAAVASPTGEIYAAARIETPDLQQSSHALRLATMMALLDGVDEIVDAAIWSAGDSVRACGACRELFEEYGTTNAELRGIVDGKEVFSADADELLPDDF